jgi:membrane-bound serine protease (ClpP class)
MILPLKRVTSVVRGRARRSFTGKEGMIGKVGTARTDLSPSSKVFVHGEIWEAEATEPVAKGEKVKVVAVLDTLKVRVRKA